MAFFFNPEKLERKIIEVDNSAMTSLSPEVKKRLDRIEGNYQQLDEILAELESKMAADDRLQAIEETSPEDFEATFGVKKKRKWRTPKPKTRKRRKKKVSASSKTAQASDQSVDPKKPR